MAQTTPKMGLVAWDQLSDPYDHSQLANNFFKLDFHDHSPGRGVVIPTEGIADQAITPAKLDPSIDLTSAFTIYKNIFTTSLVSGLGTVSTSLVTITSGNNVISSKDMIYIDPADYAVPGRSTVFRIRAVLGNNSVAPGTTVTVGLNPLTLVPGASGSINTYTMGSAVLKAIFPTPAASQATVVSGSPAALAAGLYALTLQAAASPAAGNRIELVTSVQMRQV